MRIKFISVLFAITCAFSVSAFALDTTTDILFGGFYNYSNIFTGKIRNYETNSSADYKAAFHTEGAFFGFDKFFNSRPFGIYFRAALFMGTSNIKRTVGGNTEKIRDTASNSDMFLDLGGVYAFNFGNLSLNIAPALSLLSIDSENKEKQYVEHFGNTYYTYYDSTELFGFGITVDIYVKYRYKYLAITAGMASSFYPLTQVSSSVTGSPRDTKAFNLRPYVAVGISFRKHISYSAGGK